MFTTKTNYNHLECTDVELAPFQILDHQNAHRQLNDVRYSTVQNKPNQWVRVHLANAETGPDHNK